MIQLIINTPNHEFFSILRTTIKKIALSTVQFINDTQKHTQKNNTYILQIPKYQVLLGKKLRKIPRNSYSKFEKAY